MPEIDAVGVCLVCIDYGTTFVGGPVQAEDQDDLIRNEMRDNYAHSCSDHIFILLVAGTVFATIIAFLLGIFFPLPNSKLNYHYYSFRIAS